MASASELALNRMVAVFAERVARLPGVRVLNSAQLDRVSPPSERRDVRSEIALGFPYRLPHASCLAHLLGRTLWGVTPKKAIITDLDETVLDNSALLVRDMARCHDYTAWDTWLHWEREGIPRVIPGAMEFLEFADEQGVAIYYVSDRYQENKEATLATLNELGLPQVSDDTVLLLGPPKQQRRDFVEENHTLVMQLGDTLHDFSEEFVSQVPLDEQHARVEEHAERFGQDWIVFPNATYGTWRKAELDAWEAPFLTE